MSSAPLAHAPLLAALRAYAKREAIAFHTPGHKQGQSMEPEFRALVGPAALRMDLTELDELDDLHHPEGVILEAQALAAEAFGADATYFLVNGAAAGHHAMVMAVCNPGDALIVPGDAAPSVMNGLVLAGALPLRLPSTWDDERGVELGVTPEAVQAALRAHPGAKGVLVQHPSVFGVGCDLAAIADIAHAHGKPLLVDETYGAHFRFAPSLPVSAMDAGADMAAQAGHLALSALAQTGLLHVRRGRIDLNRVRNALQLVQSSSPNYLLMASLDAARRHMVGAGRRQLGEAIALAEAARDRLADIPGLRVLGREGLFALDPTRLTLDVAGLSLTGLQVRQLLLDRHRIQVELATPRHVLLVIPLGTTERDLDRLVEALATLSA